MTTITAERIISACADDSFDAGIRIQTQLESLGGPSAKVKPATYAGGVFQLGRRWWGESHQRSPVDVITIDNEPSQANRLEAALETAREELGLPEFALDLTALEPLPPHVPRHLSSFRFPHRNADAYLRDAKVGDEDFLKSDAGQAVFGATADNADALLQWIPQALLFGFWQSHLGKKGSQAKLARAWTSEIIGIEPASGDTRTLGLKGDPLNLSVPDSVSFDENRHADWELSNKGKKLADVGHGQVPVSGEDAALSGVSFAEVVQQSTVSFAMLRRISFDGAAAEGRAVLVALGLFAHSRAFGRSFHLRSGADLRPISATWTWLGANGDEVLDPLTAEQATELFHQTVAAAEGAGAPIGTKWPEPLTLTPKDNLQRAIRATFPALDDD